WTVSVDFDECSSVRFCALRLTAAKIAAATVTPHRPNSFSVFIEPSSHLQNQPSRVCCQPATGRGLYSSRIPSFVSSGPIRRSWQRLDQKTFARGLSPETRNVKFDTLNAPLIRRIQQGDEGYRSPSASRRSARDRSQRS